MQGGNPKKLECYCLLFTRKLFKPVTRDIQAAVTESPTQEGLEGSTAVNPMDQGWLEQTRMCQLKETGLQNVSVLNTIPKFTVNHSQKGKAGTDRLFQGCHSRSTTPAQLLHPSTALCEMTTFYQSHKLGLRNTFKKSPVPQLYSTWPVQPQLPIISGSSSNNRLGTILSNNCPGPNSLGRECEGKRCWGQVLSQILKWPKALCLILPVLRKEKCVASPSSSG